MRGVVQRVWVACSVLVLAVSLASPASAAIVLVRSLGDGPANTANCPGASCRLRDAIAAAASGDTIDFAAGLSGTVSLQFAPGELVINKDLHIWGPGPDQNALVIAAPGGSRVLTVASGVSLSLHFL